MLLRIHSSTSAGASQAHVVSLNVIGLHGVLPLAQNINTLLRLCTRPVSARPSGCNLVSMVLVHVGAQNWVRTHLVGI